MKGNLKRGLLLVVLTATVAGLRITSLRLHQSDSEDSHSASFRGLECVDLNGRSVACAEVINNRTVLVFDVSCPSCAQVLSRLASQTDLVGIGVNSSVYLRYHQLKLGLRFPIYHVDGSSLRQRGLSSVPALIRLNQAAEVTSYLTGSSQIVTSYHESKEEIGDGFTRGFESDQALRGFPARTDIP